MLNRKILLPSLISLILFLNISEIQNQSIFGFSNTVEFGKRIVDAMIDWTDGVSLIDCVNMCFRYNECSSYNYIRQLRLCEVILNDDGTYAKQIINDSGSVYGQRQMLIQTSSEDSCGVKSCGAASHCNKNENGVACEYNACNSPPTLHNGYVINQSLSVGGKAQYSCNASYRLRGKGNKITCLLGPKWTSFTFKCHPIPCSNPPAVSNGYIANKHLIVGGRTKYSCNYGYKMIGRGKIFCQLGPVWTSINFFCDLILCPDPPPELENGFIRNTSGRTLDSYVDYYCVDPFWMLNMSQNRIYCQPNGTWTSINFECLDPVNKTI